MFRCIELENFLSFERVSLDLSGPKGSILDRAFIYGENGSGKTNLIRSVAFLRDSVSTIADGRTLQSFASSYRLIGSTDPMRVRYTFEADGLETVYEMVFGCDGSLTREELRQRTGSRMRRLFLVEQADSGPVPVFARGTFRRKDLRSRVMERIRRQWFRNGVLSIIYDEYSDNADLYMTEAMEPTIRNVIESIRDVVVDVAPRSAPSPVKGVCDEADIGYWNAFGNAVSKLLLSVGPKTRGARYLFTPREDGRFDYELYLDRKIAGSYRLVPGHLESSGVKVLISLLRPLMACAEGRTVFIDEFDRCIHDKLVPDLLTSIMPDLKGQLVVTTHNTSLLETMDPKWSYSLRLDSEGYADLAAFNSIARTQKSNNNRLRYLYGQFDGLPITGCVVLKEIADDYFDETSR